MSAIVVDHLSVRYGDLVAVHDIGFVAEPARITVLLGPNGAGKTSTIECIEGYRRPSGGTIRIGNIDPFTERREFARRVGVMLQHGGIQPAVRPMEILRLYEALYDNAHSPADMLAFVGLQDRAKSPWRSLSGGEQQRLALALAVIGRPQVVLLDEPTAGVDIAGRKLIRDLIADLAAQGVTVLLTTHDLAEIEVLADDIVIIDHGRVVAAGSASDLLSGADAPSFRFRAQPGLDLAALSAVLGVAVTDLGEGMYDVEASPTPPLVASLTGWLAERSILLGDLQAGRQGLEQLFVRLTSETAGADRRSESGRRTRAQRRSPRTGQR
ncbi:MAG: ABC transporter ATP-binding protein [Microthrixaceae bacterium]|nr:ABC transporter ATP-binding protein [Microthrixaceae bacterium]